MVNRSIFGRRGATMTKRQRKRTTWVLGLPDAGKTYGLISWALQDIDAGRGLCFIDPHRDAFDLLLRHVAVRAHRNPELAKKVVIIRPTDPNWAVGINPLDFAAYGDVPPERLAWFFIELAVSILNINLTQAPRMVWLMVHTTMALAELGLTMAKVIPFLRNHAWRKQVIDTQIKNPDVKEYFQQEFPSRDGGSIDWARPVLNKLGKFTLDRDFKPILGQMKSTVFPRQIMDESYIVLVDLPKGILGKENVRLMGTMLTGLFFQSSLARADSTWRPQFFVYVDEWQNFITEHIQEALSESRKYALSLVLANQFITQIPRTQRDAIIKTAGTLVAFGIGYQDAAVLAKEMWMPQAHKTKWNLRWVRGAPLVLPSREPHSEWQQSSRQVYDLISLRLREFWVKHRGPTPPVKQRTLTVEQPDCSDQMVERLVNRSGYLHARRKADVRQELEARRWQIAKLGGAHPDELEWELPPLSSY